MYSNEQLSLLWLGLYPYLGLELNMHWRDFKFKWRARHGWPEKCSKCFDTVKRTGKGDNQNPRSLTLDHIIPQVILYELELPELLFDDDNFMVLCQRCNGNKKDKLPNFSELSPRLLGKFYWAIDERNRRLALEYERVL